MEEKRAYNRMPSHSIEGKLRVKELMKERGISMQELAEKIGGNREVISRALNGNPTYSVLANIAAALNVSVPELFISENKLPKHELRGFIFFDGKLYTIDDYGDLLKVSEEVKKSYL